MCLICIEFDKQRMTSGEARRAYSEMVEGLSSEHADVVRRKIEEAERDEAKSGTP